MPNVIPAPVCIHSMGLRGGGGVKGGGGVIFTAVENRIEISSQPV